jgi:hypothetical protein
MEMGRRSTMSRSLAPSSDAERPKAIVMEPTAA